MTRYPKSGKGSKWTVKELDAVKEEWKGDTLSDSDGLSGEVRFSNSVSIHFKYAFKWNRKVAWFYCGAYPANDMTEIREERNKARDLVKSGIDPRASKKASKIEAQLAIEQVILNDENKRAQGLTFNDLYNAWLKDGVSRRDGNKYIIQSFGKHAIPILGKVELRHLSENHLRNLYRSIISDNKIATAVELSKDIGQMLRWAGKRKPWRALFIDGNPSDLVEIKKLIPKGYTKERTRYLSIDEIIKLKEIFDTTTHDYINSDNKSKTERPLKKEVQLAMWICLSTVCRIGELLMTEWRHIDFETRTWFIPKENVKGEDEDKHDQLIYLSNFALGKFEQLHKLTGDTQWAFPARYKPGHVCIKSATKQIGDRQIKFKNRTKKLQARVENNSLVLSDTGEWTPHDLRRTGTTMMQKLRVSRDVINLCQNHVIGSKVDRVYLLDEYADEKRDAWYKLGDKLDEILFSGNAT